MRLKALIGGTTAVVIALPLLFSSPTYASPAHDHGGSTVVALPTPTETTPPPSETTTPSTTPPPSTNGLEILGNDCSTSDLPPHNGFQEAPRCVSTAHGEVAAQNNNPSLLITKHPLVVQSGKPFTIEVSTQNLVRDRFLAAGQGGYYLESGFLNDQGLTRGHFHVACRLIGRGNAAPEPDRQVVFQAVEDGKGGAEPDTVRVRFAGGIQGRGQAQCAAWAGDGSHRMPMMQFANQIPAFDTVRLLVIKG